MSWNIPPLGPDEAPTLGPCALHGPPCVVDLVNGHGTGTPTGLLGLVVPADEVRLTALFFEGEPSSADTAT